MKQHTYEEEINSSIDIFLSDYGFRLADIRTCYQRFDWPYRAPEERLVILAKKTEQREKDAFSKLKEICEQLGLGDDVDQDKIEISSRNFQPFINALNGETDKTLPRLNEANTTKAAHRPVVGDAYGRA